ncbi:hypothetical protein [Neisseria iguanae]|uniref:Transposase n=1 Tax=Neisseria iguanae TaxID=90242 RepID=A0A2P7TYM3_9NEIS|nr:hypothetical protein [Neisseria iguanae]PSJ79819.1 hypothetical protein C7N83_09940 [Neisseria iguanae]
MPDHSTLYRYRNRLTQKGILSGLPDLINRQLTGKSLKIQSAKAAAIIQTTGGRQRQAIETDENSVSSENIPSKNKDARRVKKDGKFKPSCKQHTRTGSEYGSTGTHLPKVKEGIQKSRLKTLTLQTD